MQNSFFQEKNSCTPPIALIAKLAWKNLFPGNGIFRMEIVRKRNLMWVDMSKGGSKWLKIIS